MKILVVGSGGREHALCWKILQSPLLERLYIAPGNAGSAQMGENISIAPTDVRSLVNFCRQEAVDMVIIGPEAALEAGLVDALTEAGISALGPTRSAAEIETSKAFAKAFMQRWNIPTARYQTFTDFSKAVDYINSVDFPIVIKASGLAAGKGVFLPNSKEEARAALLSLLVAVEMGPAGQEVVIEERLRGPEVSLLAFTDGTTVRVMPPAQDHKRLLDDDQGPNTGGMGVIAPTPTCPPELAEELTRTVLQPAVDGLRAEGRPFCGVLYAGLMLTANGPRVLEFNARFGDPETQAILPLLETDLLEIAAACTGGTLNKLHPRWKHGAAACVILASSGYPGKTNPGHTIHGLKSSTHTDSFIFHASTRTGAKGEVQTSGGRVLGVTAWADNHNEALQQAYSLVNAISFDGMQFRRDIGASALQYLHGRFSAYASAGVDIDAGNHAVKLMSAAVRSTYTPAVLAGIGAFGGLFDASALKAMQQPVLVASTDGVGTKVKLAAAVGRYQGIGQDIVNHCIDDILVQGALPLFFLDYFATSRLSPEVVAEIVSGIAEACRESGCVLLGGETAEMPGVYVPGEFDVAGTVVGTVERSDILPRHNLQPGDLLIGLRSASPHTNGYSLLRKVFEGVALDTVFPELGLPLADVLLAPHRSYLPVLKGMLQNPAHPVKALVHITGGGFIENIPRVLPEGLSAAIHAGSWPVPPLYPLAQSRGNIPALEMYRVFNMGIGMVAIVAPEAAQDFQRSLPEESWVIGELVRGRKAVNIA